MQRAARWFFGVLLAFAQGWLLAAGTVAASPSAGVALDCGDGQPVIAIKIYRHGECGTPARLLSVGADGEALFIAATAPSLETGRVLHAAQGRLGPMAVDALDTAAYRLWTSDAGALARSRPIEAIEARGDLLDISMYCGNTHQSWHQLRVAALPLDIGHTINDVMEVAARLPPAHAATLVEAERVSTARAAGLRSDPRRPYRIVPASAASLAEHPRLRAALRHPGVVVALDADAAELLRQWQRASNPRGLGSTLFLGVRAANGDRTGDDVLQLKLQRWDWAAHAGGG